MKKKKKSKAKKMAKKPAQPEEFEIDIRLIQITFREAIEKNYGEFYFQTVSTPDIKTDKKLLEKVSNIHPFIHKGNRIHFGKSGFLILKKPLIFKEKFNTKLTFFESDEDYRQMGTSLKDYLDTFKDYNPDVMKDIINDNPGMKQYLEYLQKLGSSGVGEVQLMSFGQNLISSLSKMMIENRDYKVADIELQFTVDAKKNSFSYKFGDIVMENQPIGIIHTETIHFGVDIGKEIDAKIMFRIRDKKNIPKKKEMNVILKVKEMVILNPREKGINGAEIILKGEIINNSIFKPIRKKTTGTFHYIYPGHIAKKNTDDTPLFCSGLQLGESEGTWDFVINIFETEQKIRNTASGINKWFKVLRDNNTLNKLFTG